MGRFTAGLLTGGLIGAVSLTYALKDKKMRKQLSRDGKRMLNKANGIVGDIADMF